MRRVVELGIMGLAAGAIVAPIQLKAEEVSSVYTALDLDKCKLIEKPDWRKAAAGGGVPALKGSTSRSQRVTSACPRPSGRRPRTK